MLSKMLLYQISWILALQFAITVTVNGVHLKSDGRDKCGSLDELLHNNDNNVAAPIEHPWLGRVMFRKHNTGRSNTECHAVLITKRNLLAPAHCFKHYDGVPEAYSVYFGIWNITADRDDWSCNHDGYCVPPPQRYNLSEVAIHPDYDTLTFNNNIAVLTLETSVKITNYVQPACERPKHLADESLVEKYFYMAGFHTNSNLKSKTGVRTISSPYAERSHYGALNVFARTLFYGYQELPELFEVGSPLVAVNVVDDVPKYYFLVGYLLEASAVSPSLMVASFLDIRQFKDFIKRNIIV